MREILFRGKANDRLHKPWVYGSLLMAGTNAFILQDESDVHPLDYPWISWELGAIDGPITPVLADTVGQFTGLLDKNGTRIFEGDIVITKYGRACTVIWFSSPLHNGFDLEPVDTFYNAIHTNAPDEYDLYKQNNLEVIGNIHDNPDMLKGME